jgi:hypothetical protein
VSSQSLLDYEFYLNDKDALEAILEALASEIAMSLSSLRDQINAGLQSITNMLAPLTDLGSSGTISGEGTQAGQSETLFTIHQGVGSGVTPVGIQLTGAGRRFLSTAAQPDWRSRSHSGPYTEQPSAFAASSHSARRFPSRPDDMRQCSGMSPELGTAPSPLSCGR